MTEGRLRHARPSTHARNMKTVIKFIIVNRRSVAQLLRAIANLID